MNVKKVVCFDPWILKKSNYNKGWLNHTVLQQSANTDDDDDAYIDFPIDKYHVNDYISPIIL